MRASSHAASRRRGYNLLEVSVAGALLMVGLSLTVGLLAGSLSQRRSAVQRQWAILQATNLMERATSLPPAQITNERLHQLQVSPEFKNLFPGSALSFEVEDEGDL